MWLELTFNLCRSQEAHQVYLELSSQPFFPTLPTCALKEEVPSVIKHILDQVVSKAEVLHRQVELLPQFFIQDVDFALIHLHPNKKPHLCYVC